MGRNAFLVVTMDGNTVPPRIVEVGIFSSRGEDLTHASTRQRYVTVKSAYGQTYQDAHRELMLQLEHDDFWGWCWHMLVSGNGHAKVG
jgi:hypothetical protein